VFTIVPCDVKETPARAHSPIRHCLFWGLNQRRAGETESITPKEIMFKTGRIALANSLSNFFKLLKGLAWKHRTGE